MYEDRLKEIPTIGFPSHLRDKVESRLQEYKINYEFITDSDGFRDYGEENNYNDFLHHNLPYSYVKKNIDEVTIQGNFIIKFEGEEPQKYIIGDNIDPKAKIISKIIINEVGSDIEINNEKAIIIEKNILNN